MTGDNPEKIWAHRFFCRLQYGQYGGGGGGDCSPPGVQGDALVGTRPSIFLYKTR